MHSSSHRMLCLALQAPAAPRPAASAQHPLAPLLSAWLQELAYPRQGMCLILRALELVQRYRAALSSVVANLILDLERRHAAAELRAWLAEVAKAVRLAAVEAQGEQQ